MTRETDVPATAPPRGLAVFALTALAYAGLGWFALKLAVGPGFVSPLYPSAGLALAAALVYGLPGVLGAGVGAFAVNLGLAAARGQSESATHVLALVWLPAAIGLGAALQAAAGAALVRRFVGAPLTLSTPRDILRFCVWGGFAACLVNATLSSSVLGWAGVVAPSEWAATAWVWWTGDLLGVLIAAPVVLTMIGQPRADWAPRRLAVGVPMLLGTLLLVVASLLFNRWDEERLRAVFERSAASTGDAVEARLHDTLHALQALHGVFANVPDPTRNTLRGAAAWWLAHAPELQALGYTQRVPRDTAAGAGEADGMRITMVEPMATLPSAAGANSVPPAAVPRSLLDAARSGEVVSAAPGDATDATDATVAAVAADGAASVVVYRVLYSGSPGTEAQRLAAWRGAVFAVLRVEQALESVLLAGDSGLRWCLLAPAAPAAPAGQRRVAGASGCEQAPAAAFESRRAIDFAGQTWELRLAAQARDLPGGKDANAWLFSVVGLVATALLGVLLLTVTGRARRIERAVDERTAALTQQVGERQAAEAALRESEQRQREILEQLPIGVMFLDTRGAILEANPRLCSMLGRSGPAMRRLRVADLVHTTDLAHNRSLNARLLDGSLPVAVRELRLRRADGTDLQARATVTVLRDAEGQPQRLVGVVEDISEHLRLAESEQARAAAEASSRAKSEFVSRMSHELRTPLNAMLGFAQLLGMDRRPALASHQQAWTTQIQRAGWHLLEMINDTLDLARIESGVVELNTQAVELGPLVHASMALVSTAADKRGIVLGEQLDARAVAVMGDETRLKQVLTNLLSNAVKYNREGGHVTVQSRLAGEQQVEIIVRDTGLGMTAAQMAGLFQPYNRLGRESSTIEGTGIGLVISRRLAELMSGSLVASSAEGEGSAFTLRLPRAAFTDSGSPIRGVPEEAPAYRRRLVHYIEDNETNVEVMRGILSQRPQIGLEVSLNGLDGLAAVRQRRPDLILLDMHLPDIGGLELLRHLKHDDAVADIPVLVLSADATPARMEEALTLGAAHYLTKPVDIASFLQTLDQSLSDLDTRWG